MIRLFTIILLLLLSCCTLANTDDSSREQFHKYVLTQQKDIDLFLEAFKFYQNSRCIGPSKVSNQFKTSIRIKIPNITAYLLSDNNVDSLYQDLRTEMLVFRVDSLAIILEFLEFKIRCHKKGYTFEG